MTYYFIISIVIYFIVNIFIIALSFTYTILIKSTIHVILHNNYIDIRDFTIMIVNKIVNKNMKCFRNIIIVIFSSGHTLISIKKIKFFPFHFEKPKKTVLYLIIS